MDIVDDYIRHNVGFEIEKGSMEKYNSMMLEEILNVDGFISNPHIDFSDAQIADITDNLCYDWGFLGSAHNDIKLIKDPKLLDDLQQYVPEKLWNKIIHFNEK